VEHRVVFYPREQSDLVDLYNYIDEQSGPQRAANYVTSLCKAYPESVGVLQQSTAFVTGVTPAAGGLMSNCGPVVRP